MKKLLLLITILNTLLFSTLEMESDYIMLLSIDDDSYRDAKLRTESSKLKFSLLENNISIDRFVLEKDSLIFQSTTPREKVVNLLKSDFPTFEVNEKENLYRLKISSNLDMETSIDKTIEYLKDRYEMYGIYILDNWFLKVIAYFNNHTSIFIEKRDNNKIYIEVQHANSYAKKYIREQLGSYTTFGFYQVMENNHNRETSQKLEWVDNLNEHLYVSNLPILTEDMILSVNIGFEIYSNAPLINFQLNELGTKIFERYTKEHIHQRIAVVINRKIYSTPIIMESIKGGTIQITGNFNIQELQKISNSLNRSHHLPLVIEEKLERVQ